MDRVNTAHPAWSPGIKLIVDSTNSAPRKNLAAVLSKAGQAGVPFHAHQQELSPLALERAMRHCFSSCALDLSKKDG